MREPRFSQKKKVNLLYCDALNKTKVMESCKFALKMKMSLTGVDRKFAFFCDLGGLIMCAHAQRVLLELDMRAVFGNEF